MNRIIVGIDRAKAQIANKGLAPEKLTELHKALDMDMEEYCTFQTLKSAATGSTLTLEEAQTIYAHLGNVPEHFNAQPLEVKITLTSVYSSLLGARIKSKK